MPSVGCNFSFLPCVYILFMGKAMLLHEQEIHDLLSWYKTE